jgi:preprotein translocase subunit SecA
VYLRAYGQKDPLVEYKTEAYDMFTELMGNIKSEIVNNLFRSTANLEAFGAFLQNLPQFLISSDETGAQQTQSAGAERQPSPPSALRQPAEGAAATNGEHSTSLDEALAHKAAQPSHDVSKTGRNDPCPCGSGKKFKNCCGRTA